MSNRKGVLDKKNRTFYYLESKFANPMTSIEQVRSKLMARGVITTTRANPASLKDFPVITYEEAEDRGLKIVPLYMSKVEASRRKDA